MPSAATIRRIPLCAGRAPAARLVSGLAGLSLLASAAAAGVSVGVCARLPSKSAGDVRVIREGQPIPATHRVLGVLSMETGGPGGREPTIDWWFARFRGPAARLGADAVAGIQPVHFASRDRYFAAAVALAPSPAGETPSCDRVVALASIDNHCEGPAEQRASDEEALRLAIAYALGRRGYYLTPLASPTSGADGGPEGSAVIPGLRPRLRLALEIAPGGAPAIVEGAPVRLRATLTDDGGVERWKAEALEAFQEPADLGGAILPDIPKSRSGHLLSAVDRLVESLPVRAALPAAGASAP